MGKEYRNAVWEGRYQPIHRGHVRYAATLLERAEHVWIFVVDNERMADLPGVTSPVPEFSMIVDGHHGSEKNPLPFWLRYRMVVETLREEFGSDAPITVWGGRRLDLAWDYYRKALPPDRVFLTPERDAFEDAKAAAWRTLGERVERIDVSHIPPVSATMLRARLQQGVPVADLLCAKTEELLRRYGYLERLMDG
jgi:hypothetical protein